MAEEIGGETVISAYPGQKVHNAMIDALVKQEINRQNCARIEELEAEVARLKEELELRRQKDKYVYSRFVEDAERNYADQDKGSLLNRIIWALLGYGILAFGTLFDKLGV